MRFYLDSHRFRTFKIAHFRKTILLYYNQCNFTLQLLHNLCIYRQSWICLVKVIHDFTEYFLNVWLLDIAALRLFLDIAQLQQQSQCFLNCLVALHIPAILFTLLTVLPAVLHISLSGIVWFLQLGGIALVFLSNTRLIWSLVTRERVSNEPP